MILHGLLPSVLLALLALPLVAWRRRLTVAAVEGCLAVLLFGHLVVLLHAVPDGLRLRAFAFAVASLVSTALLTLTPQSPDDPLLALQERNTGARHE